MQKNAASSLQSTQFDCRSLIREVYKKKDLEDSSIDIILASLSENTLKQYNTAIKKWYLFCKENNHDVFDLNENLVLKFLTIQYESGAQYGSLNSMRSALSLLCNNSLTDNVTINRFLKGIFRLRPAQPKYSNTWDVDIVLIELEKWSSLESLTLERLTFKLVMLLALSTGFRVQSLSLLKLDGICIKETGIELRIYDLVKTSRPGASQPYAWLPFFKQRPEYRENANTLY